MKRKFHKTMGFKLVAVAAAAIAATTLTTTSASASDAKPLDWSKILVDVDHFVRTGTESTDPQPLAATQRRLQLNDDPAPQNLGNALFGVSPRASLAFRDWRGSTRIAGEQLMLVDALRLSASTRMLVGRARLSSASRFTPFVQLGIGQWRTDSNFLPLTPTTIEIASQIGTGFELRLNRRWQIAAETSFTSLIRERSDITAVAPGCMLWSSFIASRVEW